MRFSVAAFSLIEQIFASGFTFFLFLVATRLLEGDEQGLYVALFSLNQSFAFFIFGLVLLPVSSAVGEAMGKELGASLVLMVGLLLVFTIAAPVAMELFSSFDGHVTIGAWALAVVFFAGQSAYETARWLTIRLRGSQSALAVALARFVLFFSVILIAATGALDATRFVLIQVAVNVIAVVGYGILLRGFVGQVHWALPDRRAIKHAATFGNSLASFLTNLAVVTLVDRGLGGGALTAFQAVRSATNPIGLVSQVLDNHFSADLARTGRSLKRSGKVMLIALGGAVVSVVLAATFGPEIIALLYDGQFTEYWLLVPLLLTASLSHALTRPIFVGWRISGDTLALNRYSAIVIVIALPVLLFTGFAGFSYVMIAIFALLPAACLLVDLFRGRDAEADMCEEKGRG